MKERKEYRLRYHKLTFFNVVSGVSKVGKTTLLKRVKDLINLELDGVPHV